MTWLAWLSLAGICLAGAASPGPSLAVVLSASVGGGRTRGLQASWAHATGVALYALLTVLGASALLAATPQLFGALQLAGALYLLVLARRLLRSTGAAGNAGSAAAGQAAATATDAFAIAFLNPKLALFMLALFSQFVRPGYGPLDLATMVLTAGLVDGAWYSLVTLLLTRGAWLRQLQARAQLIDRLFGLMLALLALLIVVDLLRGHLPA